MAEKVEVELTGNVRRDGTGYGPGDMLTISDSEAQRFVRLGVAKIVEPPAAAPELKPVTAGDILGMNAKEAAKAVAGVEDQAVLAAIAEKDDRETVTKAATRRLEELGGE